MKRFHRCVQVSTAVIVALNPLCAAGAADLNFGGTGLTASAPSSGIILVGGHPHSVAAGAMVTQAEAIALAQVAQTGSQRLVIGLGGGAVGGSAVMVTNPALSSLAIPKGVTVFGDFTQNGALSLTGNLVNSGSLYAVSTSESTRNALISAQNVLNNSGAIISSILPASASQQFTNAIGDLSLTISVRDALRNTGTISSAANLAVIAATGNATINNSGGVISAPGGTISLVSNAANSGDQLSVIEGSFISPVTNVNAGCGKVMLSVDRLSGILNINAGAATAGTWSGGLTLGSVNISGDPTFFSNGADLTVSGPLPVTVGQSITLMSSRDVVFALSSPLAIQPSGSQKLNGNYHRRRRIDVGRRGDTEQSHPRCDDARHRKSVRR